MAIDFDKCTTLIHLVENKNQNNVAFMSLKN